MDEFEQKYATGDGTVHFREKSSIPRWLGLLFLSPVLTMPLFVLFVMGWSWLVPIVAALGLFAFVANVAMTGMRTVVSDAGLDVFVGMRRNHFSADAIESVEVADYRMRDYLIGRGHVKRGTQGTAYVGFGTAEPGQNTFSLSKLVPKRGVRLRIRGGERVMITSERPEELRDAILALTSPSVRARVEVDEAEEVEVDAAPSEEARRKRR